MPITDYLKVIAEQRDILKESISEKGIDVVGLTTFNQLTPKIAEIKVENKLGAQNGVWTPTVTAEEFRLTGLTFIPARLSVFCEDVLTKTLSSVTEHINIALLNIELSSREIELIKNEASSGVSFETQGISANITVEENGGLYSVIVSFAEVNSTLDVPYKFKANASHCWCVAEEMWLI